MKLEEIPLSVEQKEYGIEIMAVNLEKPNGGTICDSLYPLCVSIMFLLFFISETNRKKLFFSFIF